jgi:outer membrane protein assembly factor BamB
VTKNVICLGGGFRLGGGKSATILAVDAETGQNILWSYQTNATISSLVGKDSVLYVGGTFSSIGNQAREGLAALDIRTGAVLPWNPMGELSSLSSYRTSRLIVADSTIYVSGEAQFLQRNTRVFLSEFSLANGARTAWQPNLGDVRSISALCLTKFGLAVSGALSGGSSNFLSLLDRSNGAVIREYNFPNGFIYTMTSQDSLLYVGGNFRSVNTTPRRNLAAIHFPSGKLTEWSPYTNNNVFSLSVVGEQIYAGGEFSICGLPTVHRKNLAAIDTRTGDVLPWNPTATDTNTRNVSVNALHLTPSGLYAGGRFVTMGGTLNTSVVKFDMPSGTLSEAFRSPFISPLVDLNRFAPLVLSLASNNRRLFVGGEGFVYQFDAVTGQAIYMNDTLHGQPRRYLWEIRAPSVNALYLHNRTLYLGGAFHGLIITKPDGNTTATRRSIAAVDIDSVAVLDWQPKLAMSGLPGFPLGSPEDVYLHILYRILVKQIHVQDSKVYLGGDFSTANSLFAYRITTAFDIKTGEETQWLPRDTTIPPPPLFSSRTQFVGGRFFFDNGVIYTSGYRQPLAFDTTAGAKELWRAEGEMSGEVFLRHNTIVYAGGSGLAAFKAYTRPLMTAVAQKPFSNTPLLSVHPNPTSGVAIASYHLPAPCPIRLELFDVLGRSLRILAQETQTAGEHTVLLPTSDLRAGMYFLVLESANGKTMQRVIVGQ